MLIMFSAVELIMHFTLYISQSICSIGPTKDTHIWLNQSVNKSFGVKEFIWVVNHLNSKLNHPSLHYMAQPTNGSHWNLTTELFWWRRNQTFCRSRHYLDQFWSSLRNQAQTQTKSPKDACGFSPRKDSIDIGRFLVVEIHHHRAFTGLFGGGFDYFFPWLKSLPGKISSSLIPYVFGGEIQTHFDFIISLAPARTCRGKKDSLTNVNQTWSFYLEEEDQSGGER